MAKRETLMLAHKFDPVKHGRTINGWFVSEKLDGIRCFYDGGCTRGIPTKEIPWANTEKDYRLRDEVCSTGLWTRGFKTIRAPSWFLGSLPIGIPLDGELFTERGGFQDVSEIVKDFVPGPGWERVRFVVFDSPAINKVLSDGEITNTNFRKRITGVASFFESIGSEYKSYLHHLSYESTMKWLRSQNIENQFVEILHQEQLPFITDQTLARVDQLLQATVDLGGEGLMLRRHVSVWTPQRSWELLKYKPFEDAEGTVTGFVWGRRTAKGSKLQGKVGAIVLDYAGKRLELSGFTDAEREVVSKSGQSILERWKTMEGKQEYNPDFSPRHFPIGSQITFIYRELSNDGIPKEARFSRKRTDI